MAGEQKLFLKPALVSEPTPISVGSFGIWQFMRKPRFNWSLVDLEAESMALLGFSSGLPKSPNVWRPSTYAQPLNGIVEEAINRSVSRIEPIHQLIGLFAGFIGEKPSHGDRAIENKGAITDVLVLSTT